MDSFPPMAAPPRSGHAGFPIIAVAIIGIIATGFLLVSYYVFVIKCCLNWHRIDVLRRFSLSGRRVGEDPLTVGSPAAESRGLDEATIRSIPVFPYRKWRRKEEKNASDCECAVCLNEFQEEEQLRVIPDCAHVFHVDCIDVWLQNNANCPLCRTSVSAARRSPLDQFMAPISLSPRRRDNFSGRDEDYVVIEITQEPNRDEQSLPRVQERSEEGIRKIEQKLPRKKKKLSFGSFMGDECVDIFREKDEQFVIQPMRRSFSMDSASDPHLHLAVQEIIKDRDGTSSSSRMKRSFFSFGHGIGRTSSRSAVLPVHMEP